MVFLKGNGTQSSHLWPRTEGVCTSSPVLAPLAELEGKVSVVRGIQNEVSQLFGGARDHDPDFPTILTGRGVDREPSRYDPSAGRNKYQNASGPSIDQVLARRLRGETPYPSLHFGVLSGGNLKALWRGAREPELHRNDPYELRDELFQGAGLDREELRREREARSSVLDLVARELREVQCAMGAEERERFQSHLASIEQLEASLASSTPADCAPPALEEGVDPTRADDLERVGRMQMDLLALSLACDQTRVATIQFHQPGSNLRMFGVDEWHNDIHSNNDADAETRILTFFAEQLAYPAKRLDAVDEGPRTLLDNTVILAVDEQATTASHGRTDVHYVLIGACGGALRAGVYHDYGGRRDRPGPPHNRLLTTLLRAMGQPDEGFGDPDFDGSPFSGPQY